MSQGTVLPSIGTSLYLDDVWNRCRCNVWLPHVRWQAIPDTWLFQTRDSVAEKLLLSLLLCVRGMTCKSPGHSHPEFPGIWLS